MRREQTEQTEQNAHGLSSLKILLVEQNGIPDVQNSRMGQNGIGYPEFYLVYSIPQETRKKTYFNTFKKKKSIFKIIFNHIM